MFKIKERAVDSIYYCDGSDSSKKLVLTHVWVVACRF